MEAAVKVLARSSYKLILGSKHTLLRECRVGCRVGGNDGSLLGGDDGCWSGSYRGRDGLGGHSWSGSLGSTIGGSTLCSTVGVGLAGSGVDSGTLEGVEELGHILTSSERYFTITDYPA